MCIRDRMGNALIHKADNSAFNYYKKFVANYRGNLFVKDASVSYTHLDVYKRQQLVPS